MTAKEIFRKHSIGLCVLTKRGWSYFSVGLSFASMLWWVLGGAEFNI